jgi:Tfp pilus assembly protein PilO
MSDEDDVKPLLVEIRDIVLRHEEVNRRDAEFRKRVLFALLFALAAAVLAMGYALLLVHTTTKEIRQRQEQQQPQKVASLSTWHVGR